MCGIAYIKRNDNHSPVKPLIAAFEKQRGRGTNGFGFVAVRDGYVIGYERREDEKDIMEELNKFHHADEILFHHRFPTSTANVREAAHPIFVSNPLLKSDYYFVHNGVLRNESERKKAHNGLGFEYTTELEMYTSYKQKVNGKKIWVEKMTGTKFNDSESLAIDFALWNEELENTIDSRGSMAFIALEVDKNTGFVKALHYGKNSQNPLKIFRAHGLTLLSSVNENKQANLIEDGKVYTIDRVENKFIERPVVLESSYSYTPYSSETQRSSSAYQTHAHTKINWGGDASTTSSFRQIGYDVTEEGEEKKTTIMLPGPMQYTDPRNYNIFSELCVHNTKRNDCTSCLVNILDGTSTRTCKRSGEYVQNCSCKKCGRIRKLAEREKEKARAELDVIAEDVPSPYFDNTGGMSAASKLEIELAELENELDDMQYRLAQIQNDQSSEAIKEWLNLSEAVDLKRAQVSECERNLERAISFQNGEAF